MTNTTTCPLCNIECEILNSTIPNSKAVICKRCGEFHISERAKHHLDKRKNNFHTLSGVIRNFNEKLKDSDDSGTMFVINDNMIIDDATFQATFLNKEPKTIAEKTSLLLQYIAKKSEYPGKIVLMKLQYDYPICFCKNSDELYFYIKHLEEYAIIKEYSASSSGYELFLTPQGWQEIDNLNKPNAESKQAFVAMWFDSQMDEPFVKGILPLEDQNETGFKMMRIDQKPFNDKICDHIIAEIKQSRFMIADCTELRPAVFFEAGYAMGMGLPVIFTCREGTDIKKCFDTDHYNHIVWKDAEDLRTKLKDRILATIGRSQ